MVCIHSFWPVIVCRSLGQRSRPLVPALELYCCRKGYGISSSAEMETGDWLPLAWGARLHPRLTTAPVGASALWQTIDRRTTARCRFLVVNSSSSTTGLHEMIVRRVGIEASVINCHQKRKLVRYVQPSTDSRNANDTHAALQLPVAQLPVVFFARPTPTVDGRLQLLRRGNSGAFL